MEKSKYLQKVDAVYEELEQAMSDHSKYGACDSEPYYVKNNRIRKALEDGIFPEKRLTAKEWQLYTYEYSNTELKKVASALNKPLFKLMTLIKNCPQSKINELRNYYL